MALGAGPGVQAGCWGRGGGGGGGAWATPSLRQCAAAGVRARRRPRGPDAGGPAAAHVRAGGGTGVSGPDAGGPTAETCGIGGRRAGCCSAAPCRLPLERRLARALTTASITLLPLAPPPCRDGEKRMLLESRYVPALIALVDAATAAARARGEQLLPAHEEPLRAVFDALADLASMPSGRMGGEWRQAGLHVAPCPLCCPLSRLPPLQLNRRSCRLPSPRPAPQPTGGRRGGASCTAPRCCRASWPSWCCSPPTRFWL